MKNREDNDQNLKYFENLKNEWSVIKIQLLEQFKELKEEDLNYVEGKEDELLKKIEKKLGKTREEVERLLQDLYLSAPKAGSQQTKNLKSKQHH